MKKIILKLMLIFLSVSGMSQTIPNADFENVNGNGFPDGWSGDGFGFGSSGVAQSGTKAMEVWNWYYYAKGYGVNGPSVSPWMLQTAGSPYTQKAIQMDGFYRYDTTDTYSENDSAMVVVLLKKFNTTTQQIDTVGLGKIHLPAYMPGDNSFKPFSVSIEDWMPSVQPDSIVVYFQSSLSGFCQTWDDGNCLYFTVDNLSLVTPTGISDLNGNDISCMIYPNPSQDNFTIQYLAQPITNVSLFDLSGKQVNSFNYYNGNSIDISHLPSGIYMVNILLENGMRIERKLVKQ